MQKNKPFDPDAFINKYDKPAFDPDAFINKYSIPEPEKTMQASDYAQQLETFGRSAAEGATIGLSEPVLSGINAAIGNLIDAGFDAESARDYISKAFSKEQFEKNYEADVARRRGLKEEYTKTDIAGQIGGVILPALATGGTSALTGVSSGTKGALEAVNIGGKLSRGTSTALKGGLEAIPGIKGVLASEGAIGGLSRIGLAGLEGAAQVGVMEGGKRVLESATGFIKPEDQLPDLTESMILGGKIGAGMKALPMVWQGVKSGSKKALSSWLGAPEEGIESYLKNSKAIDEALPREDLVKEVQSQIQGVQRQGATARQDLAENVVQSIEDLKSNVIKQSENSYQILDNSKGKLEAKTILDAIKKEKQALERRPGVIAGDANKQAYQKLDSLEKDIKSLAEQGGDFSFREVKDILKNDIDPMLDWGRQRAGEFSPVTQQSLKGVRYTIDQAVKQQVPEYASAMKELADNASILDEASKRFGNIESVLRKIKPTGLEGTEDAKVLAALNVKTGNTLQPQVEQMQKLAPISEMADTTQRAETLVNTFMSNRSMQSKESMQLLSQLSEKDLVAMAEKTRLAQMFEKTAPAGSKYVNMGAFVGKALAGGIVGGIGGMGSDSGWSGFAAGAMLGGMVDKYGPKATKQILKGVNSIKGLPTIQKIDQALADIPPQLKEEIKNGFIRTIGIVENQPNPNPLFIPVESRAVFKKDIQSTNHLSNIEKAKAIDGLNKDGYVPEYFIKRVMISKDQGEKLRQEDEKFKNLENVQRLKQNIAAPQQVAVPAIPQSPLNSSEALRKLKQSGMVNR